MFFLFYFSVGTLFVIEMTGEKCPNQPEFPYFQNSYIPDILLAFMSFQTHLPDLSTKLGIHKMVVFFSV